MRLPALLLPAAVLAGCTVQVGRDPATRKTLYSSDAKKTAEPQAKKAEVPVERKTEPAPAAVPEEGPARVPEQPPKSDEPILRKNWTFSTEDSPVDFDKGGPADWYPALYDFVRAQNRRLAEPDSGRNPLYVEGTHARASRALANMEKILVPEQAKEFRALADDYEAIKRKLLDRRLDRQIVTIDLQEFNRALAEKFPPDKAKLRPASDFETK